MKDLSLIIGITLAIAIISTAVVRTNAQEKLIMDIHSFDVITNCQDLMFSWNRHLRTPKSETYCQKVLKEADIGNEVERRLKKFTDEIEKNSNDK